jgi:transcription elongation factor Elf1
VAIVFDCPFCGKTDACAVRMDFEHKLGTIQCDACAAKNDSRISRLSEPIDVYAEWIDQCEEVNAPGHASTSRDAGGDDAGDDAGGDDDEGGDDDF